MFQTNNAMGKSENTNKNECSVLFCGACKENYRPLGFIVENASWDGYCSQKKCYVDENEMCADVNDRAHETGCE